MEEETTQEKFRKDIIIGLNLNLKQFMEIIKPVNFTSKLSRRGVDKKWLESGGISKMFNKLKEIIMVVEYIRDHSEFADKTNNSIIPKSIDKIPKHSTEEWKEDYSQNKQKRSSE